MLVFGVKGSGLCNSVGSSEEMRPGRRAQAGAAEARPPTLHSRALWFRARGVGYMIALEAFDFAPTAQSPQIIWLPVPAQMGFASIL